MGYARAHMNLANLSGYSLTVVLITLLVGIITQAINSGKILGQFQVPPKVMVWITFILPMLAGFGTSLQQSGKLSVLTAINALIAGLYAVIGGTAPGFVVHAALHSHFNVPKLVAAFRAKPSNDNGNAAPSKAA